MADRDEQIKNLEYGDPIDKRTAREMRRDSGLSRAKAQQKAFRQLINEQARGGNG